MTFSPQTMFWPGTRAILLVHGIGDASTGKEGAFPLENIANALGEDATRVAIYRFNYDFINDWLSEKTQCVAGVKAMKKFITGELGDDASNATIADYAGDVVWPVLCGSLRLAVRDAFIAQLQQIQIDRGESALRVGDDPLDYQISIIAHSLGCFHTYEVLSAIAEEPEYELRPASDLFTFDSVIMMASPVQLIRSVAKAIGPLVPDPDTLATVSRPLAIPSETRRGKTVFCTNDFISLTGTHDPVGGHVLGRKLDWAYMDIPGQKSIVVPQRALNIDTQNGTALALARAFATGGPAPNDPHSWSAYIASEAKLLRGFVLA